MTLSQPDDINPTFEWKPEYLTQLQHIADTDEFQSYDGTPHLGSSSAASGSSPPPQQHSLGAYDWQTLKEAIKYRIKICLKEDFGEARELDLHPATVLMPWVQPGSDLEVTWHRANMGMLCTEAETDEVEKVEAAEGDEAMANEVDVDAANASTSTSAEGEANTASTEASETEADHAQANGTTEASASATAASAPVAEADDAASPTSSDEAATTTQYSYRARFHDPPERAGRTFVHPPFVHRADVQNFYPSKRPPVATSTTPLSPSELATHTTTLYSMLEDFDVQPPFTIQRLCELVVAPTVHYNSARKWIAALKRCLSVTATRDAFPISPVQAPVGVVVGVNGHGGDDDGVAASDVSDIEMDRMDGLPPSTTRSRSSSVGSNASVSAEPLFSPIPFIVRDENGLLTGTGQQQPQQRGEEEGEQTAAMDPIPDLELGGADRTHSMNVLPKEVVDVAPTAATNAAFEGKDGGAQDGEAMQEDAPTVQTTAAPATVAAAVDASTSTASSSSPAAAAATTPATSEPLGLLPDGAVDELDNPSHTVHPLTSTTSTPSTGTGESAQTAAATAAAGAAQAGNHTETQGKEEADAHEDAEPEDAHRSSKRRKSVASLHDE
ncbi:hypothetical protein EX895_000676 [Sporisorium graminicola]|uniref:PPP4R2-domain-containing protein n=1 Tax=Sporisorium graminicola TaxID=280036 RepID=A0A4U7L416_9BASI|nr:hypothetical protein EX895_000676 [Sporisorium graminicola]TKY90678.1 hypothetical protein EX895_000676 [Sporisorium graminicola]